MTEPIPGRVTVTDPLTGEADAVDDYVITCAGSCYVDHIQTFPNGTHVITVKGRKRG